MPDTFKEAEVDGQINQLLSNQIHIQSDSMPWLMSFIV